MILCAAIGTPRPATSLGLTPAIAVATGRATANPPGPTIAVATGLDDATPPTPAIANPTGLASATDASLPGTLTCILSGSSAGFSSCSPITSSASLSSSDSSFSSSSSSSSSLGFLVDTSTWLSGFSRDSFISVQK